MDLIAELEMHKKERGEYFSDFEEYEEWCDKVLPLLKFVSGYETPFLEAKNNALISNSLGLDGEARASIDESISLVNQAIVYARRSQKNNTDKDRQDSKKKDALSTDKATLGWIINHVPVRVVLGFASGVLTALGVVFWFGVELCRRGIL